MEAARTRASGEPQGQICFLITVDLVQLQGLSRTLLFTYPPPPTWLLIISFLRKPMAMRTLILLIALLLLAMQTQAEPLLGRAEEALDQEQLGDDDQDISISLGGEESTALLDAGR